MNSERDPHQEQIAYWNGIGAQKWLAAQAQIDAMLVPVTQMLLDRAAIRPGTSIVDIGCGCGATTAELAKATGPQGRTLAIDVSAPMVAFARSRLAAYPQVEVACADASDFPFTSFADLAFSRFGVMFFGNPEEAFANIRRALKPKGRLLFICWRKLEENPWMRIPLQAAYDAGVPRVPRPEPGQPGPFSLADPDRIAAILTRAGFGKPGIIPADLELDLAAGGGLDAAVKQGMTIGPASFALRDQPEELREAARHAMETVLTPFARGERVPLKAGMWIVEAEQS